jgi:GMP synthase-like glutamine amidotransferase
MNIAEPRELYQTIDQLIKTLEQDITEKDEVIRGMRKRYNMDKYDSILYNLVTMGSPENDDDKGDYIKRLEERVLQLNIEYKAHLEWVIRGTCNNSNN